MRRRSRAFFVVSWVALALACGGIRTVSKDGYRATLLFSPTDRYDIAVRGELRRVEGNIGGSPLVKILRPDLKKVWQFRPRARRILEETWSPGDEIAPGFPLDPRFDSKAWADRYHGEILKIADGVQSGHPCDRYQMDLPNGDRVTIWAARDLERIPVRLVHARKTGEDEYQPISDVQLVNVRVGADQDLFDKPKGFAPVKSYEELRGRS